jgi:hypothetical protein
MGQAAGQIVGSASQIGIHAKIPLKTGEPFLARP